MGKKRKTDDDCITSQKEEVVTCTICLEDLTYTTTSNLDDNRTSVKLQCGHQFHLDCIGSAFNSKRAMQCPNCRRSEKGQWRLANRSRPLREFNIDDLASGEDMYYLTSSELAEMASTISGLRREKANYIEKCEQLQKIYEELTDQWEVVRGQVDLCASTFRRNLANFGCNVPILSDIPEGTSQGAS